MISESHTEKMKPICVVYHNPRQTSEPEFVPSVTLRGRYKKEPARSTEWKILLRDVANIAKANGTNTTLHESSKKQKTQVKQQTDLFVPVNITEIIHYVTSMDPSQPSSSFRDPSKLFFQKDNTRRAIIIAYWFLIILALPLWWYTTSIERLSLPSYHVHQQAKNQLQLPVRICLKTMDEHLPSDVRTSFAEKLSLEPQRWGGLVVDVFGKANCSMSFSFYILRCR